jgi:predicted kinase
MEMFHFSWTHNQGSLRVFFSIFYKTMRLGQAVHIVIVLLSITVPLVSCTHHNDKSKPQVLEESLNGRERRAKKGKKEEEMSLKKGKKQEENSSKKGKKQEENSSKKETPIMPSDAFLARR